MLVLGVYWSWYMYAGDLKCLENFKTPKNYLIIVVSSRWFLVVFGSNPPSGVYSEETIESFYVDVVSYTQSENTQRFCIYEISALSRFFFPPCWYVISFTRAVKIVGFSIDVHTR